MKAIRTSFGSSPPLLEVCISSFADALMAVDAGADRLELCSALEVGGLTPSIGLIKQVVGAVSVPVMVMVRPRVGGFCYDEREFSTMQADAEEALAAGAQGVVFGCLTDTGEINRLKTERLTRLARDRQTVFHRAIDLTVNPIKAVCLLADLGLRRVLTSGGALRALDGLEKIRAMADGVGDKLEILPCGGVRAENVHQVLSETGCHQVHVGAWLPREETGTLALCVSGFCDVELLATGKRRALNPSEVSAVARQLRKAT